MKKTNLIIIILLFFLGILSFVACTEKESINDDSTKESSYAKIMDSELQGWDYGFVKGNDIFTFYKDDTENNLEYLHFISAESNSQISIILSNDSVIGFVSDSTYFSVSQNKNNIIISSIDNDIAISTKETRTSSNKLRKISAQTRFSSVKAFESLMTAKDFYGYAQSAWNIGGDFSNQLWTNFFEDLGNAIANGVLNKALSETFGLSSSLVTAPFDMVSGTIEQSVRNNAKKIYGNSSVEITDVRKGGDGNIEIYVTIHGLNTIPQYLYRYYEQETNETTRNRVYCSVIGRFGGGLPTYRTNDQILRTKEVEIPTDGSSSELYLMFTVPSVGAGTSIRFRPYLKSTRIKNIWNDVDEAFIRYGNPINYTDINGTILSVDKIDATASVDSIGEHFVHFKYDVKAKVETLENIEEWGIYVLNDDGTTIKYPSEFKAAKLEDCITIDNLNFNKNEFDELNYNEFKANIKVKIGVYYKTKNSQGLYDYLNEYYGTPQEYNFEYDEKASLRYLDSKILGTEIISTEIDENGNKIVNYETSFQNTFQITGIFWIDYLDLQVEGNNWHKPSVYWYVKEDGLYEYKDGAIYSNLSTGLSHNNFFIIHLTNGSQIRSDNYLSLSGNGTITGVSIIGNNKLRKQKNSNIQRKLQVVNDNIQQQFKEVNKIII